MLPQLQAHFVPSLISPESLSGSVVVVIDVIRASTTICHALAAGAREVIPCLKVEEARRTAKKFSRRQVVLGGERNGLRIDGFDLGNSPGEYTPETVAGKTVVFTSTNGTKAMMQCRGAKRVLIGCFVNLSAVYGQTSFRPDRQDSVHLLCAGSFGEISGEDALFAGALAGRWSRDATYAMADMELSPPSPGHPRRHPLNDQARLAQLAWEATLQRAVSDESPAEASSSSRATISPHALGKQLLRHTHGGRNVESIGLDDDVFAVAHIDRFDFVPELDLEAWKIIRPS